MGNDVGGIQWSTPLNTPTCVPSLFQIISVMYTLSNRNEKRVNRKGESEVEPFRFLLFVIYHFI